MFCPMACESSGPQASSVISHPEIDLKTDFKIVKKMTNHYKRVEDDLRKILKSQLMHLPNRRQSWIMSPSKTIADKIYFHKTKTV